MNWKKLHFTLFTIFRYFLATMILSYAFAKILGTQFTSQPSTYDQPIGSLSGFNLTWYYYGYSFWYGVVIATSQIASSLLLFFRKTTRIGIVLFLSFMVNILLVDYAYDIHGAKGMATIMTLMAFFIFFSEYPLFIKYFFTEPSFGQDAEKPLWVSKFRKVKWVYIPLAFIVIFFGILALKSKYMEKNQFYGTWQSVDKAGKLKNFNFEIFNTFQVKGANNIDKITDGTYSFTNDTITLKTFSKEYKQVLENDKTGAIANPDSTKTITFLKGRFQLTDKQLTIKNDTIKIVLKRIR